MQLLRVRFLVNANSRAAWKTFEGYTDGVSRAPRHVCTYLRAVDGSKWRGALATGYAGGARHPRERARAHTHTHTLHSEEEEAEQGTRKLVMRAQALTLTALLAHIRLVVMDSCLSARTESVTSARRVHQIQRSVAELGYSEEVVARGRSF